MNNLPRGLTPTYERILRKINGCDTEVQELVRRTLRWLFIGHGYLSAKELCQAVATEIGDLRINHEAIPDELDILRNCGSLLRKSACGKRVEFAHFTVKEFLSQLGSTRGSEFADFMMEIDVVKDYLAKVCLTYVNMQDFSRSDVCGAERLDWSFKNYADRNWPDLVCD